MLCDSLLRSALDRIGAETAGSDLRLALSFEGGFDRFLCFGYSRVQRFHNVVAALRTKPLECEFDPVGSRVGEGSRLLGAGCQHLAPAGGDGQRRPGAHEAKSGQPTLVTFGRIEVVLEDCIASAIRTADDAALALNLAFCAARGNSGLACGCRDRHQLIERVHLVRFGEPLGFIVDGLEQ